MSALEEAFAGGLRIYGGDLPAPAREYRFHPTRRWRFDFCWPVQLVAVEIQGGLWHHKGAHTSGVGVRRDAEKATAAALLGWSLLLFTTDDLNRRRLCETIAKVRQMLIIKGACPAQGADIPPSPGTIRTLRRARNGESAILRGRR